MGKKLKDYLHFYKDCIVQVKRFFDNEFSIGRVCEISSKSNHGDWVMVWFDDVITVTSMTWETSTSNAHHFFFGQDHIKPILRHLSTLTKEEMEECGNMVYDFSDEPDLNKWEWKDFEIGLAPEQFVWLLSKYFDLFGLIEAGLAISASKLKDEQSTEAK